MTTNPSRRQFLATAGLAAAALSLPRSASAALPRLAPRDLKRSLRLAHLTDIHVQPELRAGDGLAECLRHVHNLADKPELILTGGDMVYDSYDQVFDRTKSLWDLFTRSLKDQCQIPVEHCLGNHDIWGWNKSKSGTTGTEKGWGKAWACEALGLPRAYRSFDLAGWHIIILDSVQPHATVEGGYIGKLDEPQLAWLQADLAATPKTTPILILSHIPILSASALLSGKKAGDALEIRDSMSMADAATLHRLFTKHGNVRLCLSGHIHQNDRTEFEGVTYLCDGAVCGSWWKGPNGRCVEGYGVVDLFDDGSFKHEYTTYGWKAEK